MQTLGSQVCTHVTGSFNQTHLLISLSHHSDPYHANYDIICLFWYIILPQETILIFWFLVSDLKLSDKCSKKKHLKHPECEGNKTNPATKQWTNKQKNNHHPWPSDTIQRIKIADSSKNLNFQKWPLNGGKIIFILYVLGNLRNFKKEHIGGEVKKHSLAVSLTLPNAGVK